MSKECHTVDESLSNKGLSGIYKTKTEAKKEAKRKMRSYGGRWGVCLCEEGYFDAHEQYFVHHNIKPVWMGGRFFRWLKLL